jgi:hypothetical protein
MESKGIECEVVILADGIFHGLHQKVEIHSDILMALGLCIGSVTLLYIDVDTK